MHGYARRTLLTGTLNTWTQRARIDPREQWERAAAIRIDGTVLADQMLWRMCNRTPAR